MMPIRSIATIAVALMMSAVALTSADAAVRPPAGTPDLTAMPPTVSDLPHGAIVIRQGYGRDPGAAAAFFRTFVVPQRSGLALVLAYADFFRQAEDGQADFAVLRGLMVEPRLRAKLARLSARQLGLPAKHVRAGRPRDVRLGDEAVMLPFTIHWRGRRITCTVSFLDLGRVLAELDVAGAPGAGHVVSRSRRLLKVMSERVRAALLPISTAPPTVTANGGVLHADPGTWSDATKPSTFAYQWQRCDASGGGCAPIPGANGQDYTLTPHDAGSTLRVQVTARNAVGGTNAVSSAVAG